MNVRLFLAVGSRREFVKCITQDWAVAQESQGERRELWSPFSKQAEEKDRFSLTNVMAVYAWVHARRSSGLS